MRKQTPPVTPTPNRRVKYSTFLRIQRIARIHGTPTIPPEKPRGSEFPILTRNMTLDWRGKQEIRDFHDCSFCQDTAARHGEHWKEVKC